MIKMTVLVTALLLCGMTESRAQVSASNPSESGSSARPAVANEYEWYPVSGSLMLQTQGKIYSFKSLKMRKIEGIKVELMGSSPESAAEFLFAINTLDAGQLFRPGLSYVSEGNLEHGETFLFNFDTQNPSRSIVSQEAGGLLKVLSVRGGTIKMEISGKFDDSTATPYQASLDLIDARYGK